MAGIVKTGRTHLMDAMPVTLSQELSGWRTQIENGIARVQAVQPRLLELAQGGTAVGTGINAHPQFGAALLRRAVGDHRAPVPSGAQLLRGHVGAGHRGGAVRAAEGGRGQPDEDRQRPALDEQRAARRAWARSRCRRCSPAAASCPAR